MSHASERGKLGVDHVTRYEALRAYGITRHAPPSRDGLIILLRHGLAAWMAAWSTLPAPRPQPARADPLAMPDDISVDVVHVLATMTLSHFQEAYP